MITMDNIEPFETIYEVIEMLIAKYGAIGIAAAMFAESAGVPFASAVVLLTAGTMILRGSVSFWSILLASTIGITLGSIFSYTLGLLGSIVGSAVRATYLQNRLNTRQTIATSSRSKFAHLWDRYGNFSIFMAQLWGFSRTFISFPAGAMHMNFYLFIVYTFLGGSIFSLFAILASIALTRTMSYTIMALRALAGLSPWLITIPVLIVLLVIYYFFFYRKGIAVLSFTKKLWSSSK
jgi:membrane protein DedA with SNARE-associated domain